MRSVAHRTPTRAVLLVDDHRVFADALAFALDAQPDLRCVAVAGSVRGALDAAAAGDFDVAIIDLNLPDGGGLTVVEQLRALRPAAQLIVLTGHDQPGLAERTRRAGADVFLPKDDALCSVLDAIRGGDGPGEPGPDGLPRLSPREREVLALLASGHDATRIAAALELSVHTVRDYIKTLRAKLGVRSQLDAVLTADRFGLVARADRFR
ncbi:response regulator [Dactylosporangium sp. CA-233914]|uniref:response regulator n=1 Tax=Dactylosporangium sp. CA-233914 TaxID=3239934 RepID=UPI003D8CC77C